MNKFKLPRRRKPQDEFQESPRASAFWTPQAIETLIRLHAIGNTPDQCASLLGCSPSAVMRKLAVLKLQISQERPQPSQKKPQPMTSYNRAYTAMYTGTPTPRYRECLIYTDPQ